MSDQKVLFQKIARIMGRLDRMPKTGTNKHFGYKFVTDADVADMIRAELAAENIAFFASMVAESQNVIGEDRKGNTIMHTKATFEYTFACAESGETVTMTWTGEANDNQDKGLSKAATSAEKYFLLKTFMLSTGDKDDDPDNSAETRPERTQAPPARASHQARGGAPPPPERATSATFDDGKGNSPDPRDDGHVDDFPRTIRDFWPDVASTLLSKTVQALPEGLNIGAIIYPVATNALGYENSDAVKRTLKLDSITEFVGTLEALMLRVIELSPMEQNS